MMKVIKFGTILISTVLCAHLSACQEPDTIPEQPQTAEPEDVASTPAPEPSEPETPPEPVDPLAQFDEGRSQELTETARFLAGMPVESDSAIAQRQDTAAWQAYANTMEQSWSRLESQQLAKAGQWAESELAVLNEPNPEVFYPFSGPDILYAYTFFPEAERYVMVGLEPVENVPDIANLSDAQLGAEIENIRKSLYAILQFSFFRTKDMEVDLDRQGVLPILLVFLARTNNQILDVSYVSIDEAASLKDVAGADEAASAGVPGVKIAFVPEGGSEPKYLYYFATDLSNAGLDNTPEFSEFVKGMNEPVTYLKAASYLMHYDSFTEIRDLILAQSSAILQDDSGIPLRHFQPSNWELQFYGTYTNPINLFSEFYQSDLRNVYQTSSDIKPLDFGIGYKFRNDSNLMLAIEQEEAEGEAENTEGEPEAATP